MEKSDLKKKKKMEIEITEPTKRKHKASVYIFFVEMCTYNYFVHFSQR